MYSRRDLGRLAMAATSLPLLAQKPAPKKIDSTIKGVQLGAQTYSFRDRPLDGMLQAMVEVGLGDCEVYSPHVEPKMSGPDAKINRETLREWRIHAPMDVMRQARKKFDDAGIAVSAYNLSFKDDFTDEEIDHGFQLSKAFGVNMITTSSTLSVVPRLVKGAEKYQMIVAFHGHDKVADPNEFAKPESFAKALAMSKQFRINLDIGHFVAAGYDPIPFIEANHEKITILHLKDRKKGNHDLNLPWGQGDTPIKQVLQLLRDKKWPIKAFIEYEYMGKDDSVTEVKRCFQYCKDALA
jgi:sugar phosphate isomerase/epimerase